MKTLKISLSIICIMAITTTLFAQKKPVKQGYMCTTIEPKLVYHLDSADKRGLADNYFLWDNGKTIYIKFLSGSPELQDKIQSIAKQWEQYANLHFVFVTFGAAQIRIKLDDKGGCNSSVGTQALNVAIDEKTINFDTTWFTNNATQMYRTVIHEFGHAIGLLHEHFSPVSGIDWNKDYVYDYCKRTQGWDKETVDFNLFQQYKLTYTNGTSYDRKSIMHYPILPGFAKNGYVVDWNNQLSDGDIALIKALYPMNGERINEVPRFSITNFTTMDVMKNTSKQGLSMFPSFTINTAGRPGRAFFVVLFYDQNDNAIKATDENYSVFGYAGAYKTFVLEAGQKLSANKLSAQDFELFMPYDKLPVPTGVANVKARFMVFLYTDDKEFKQIYSASLVPFSFMKT
jgi:hypothetical protein